MAMTELKRMKEMCASLIRLILCRCEIRQCQRWHILLCNWL